MLIKSTSRVITANGLYLTAFGLYFIYAFFATSMYNDFLPVRFDLLVLAVVAPLLLVKIIVFDHYRFGQWLLLLAIFAISLLSARTSGRYVLIAVTLLILGARQVPFSEIAKTALFLGVLTLGLIVLSAQFELIPNLQFVRDGAYRNSFGIQYPTDFAAHIFYLLLTYAVVKQGHFKWFDYLISLFAAWFINVYCDVRLDVILIILLLIVLLIYQLILKGVKPAIWVGKLSVAAMFVCTLLSLGLSYFYSPKIKWLAQLNQLLSSRLRLGRLALDRYQPQLLGQVVHVNGWGGSQGFKQFTGKVVAREYFYIDSAYLTTLLTFGIIVSLILLLSYTWFAWRQVQQQNYLLPLIIAVTAISCIVDQHLLDISYNIFILALLADTKTLQQPTVIWKRGIL